MEYTVRFIADDGSETTKIYKLIPSSTMKARSILSQFFRQKEDGQAEVNMTKLADIISQSDTFAKLMSTITVGDQSVDWFTADSTVCDQMISDFFTSFAPKTSE